MESNCTNTDNCLPYAVCVNGFCRCELGFAPDKNHPKMCRQPSCANEFCLRCFASQECMHCAKAYSYLDPDNQQCVVTCPRNEYSLVFNGMNHNKVCKQGWVSFSQEGSRLFSLSTLEIIIIVVSCSLAVVLFTVSLGFTLFYRKRHARRRFEAFQRAQMRANGCLPSLRDASRRQSYAVSSISAAVTTHDPLFNVSRQRLSENGKETRLFLAQVGILRPHTPTFKAMLWDLEKWIDRNKKIAASNRKLFRHRSFNGSVNPSTVNYGVSRNQLKRILVILERYPMVTVDPQEGCKLLRWGQECLSRFLAHYPPDVNPQRLPSSVGIPSNASFRSERASPREPALVQRSNSSAGEFVLPACDGKKRPLLQLSTFRPLVSGLEKIVEDDHDAPEATLHVSRNSDALNHNDVRKTCSFHGHGTQPISTSF